MYTGGNPTTDACTRYRQVLPVAALAAQGHDVALHEVVDGVVWQDYAGDPRVVNWEPSSDIVVFQRPLSRDIADLIEIAATKCAVVIDMDDDFYTVPRENKAWAQIQPDINPLANTDHLRRAINAAHLVTVTTPALARRYGKAKSVVVPNYVPASYLQVQAPVHPLRIGWTGTMLTHPHDLESTRGAVAQALRSYPDVAFHVIGDGAGVREALELHNETECTIAGWVPFDDYPQHMAGLDVGIVPLQSSAFNHGKSWLKLLEFAALGVPAVGSNSAANVDFACQAGVSAIVRSPRQWQSALTQLLASVDLRQDVAGRGREVVKERFTIEGNATKWLDAWVNALADLRIGALL